MAANCIKKCTLSDAYIVVLGVFCKKMHFVDWLRSDIIPFEKMKFEQKKRPIPVNGYTWIDLNKFDLLLNYWASNIWAINFSSSSPRTLRAMIRFSPSRMTV